MRKAFPVLALIAFACDISRDVLVHGDPARKPEAARLGDGYEYQKESRGQFEGAEVPRRSAEDRQRSDEPVGKWRSNGEALEPKWRDGDSVPLLPFSHYRSYRDEVDDVEQEDSETSRRPFKYRYALDQPDRPRGSPTRRAPLPDDHDHGTTYRSRDDEPDEDYPRKRRRPLKNPHDSNPLYEETVVNATSNDGKRGRNIVDNPSNYREATSRYREAFQARPDEYEREFNDEEYLRPRPRKRRPPQNYEFALANEASSNEGDENPSRDPSRPNDGDENLPAATRPSDNKRKNALELKSLLKMQQEEGSSLSEILQRRNLTLSDLLKGKTDVINALKSRIADESDEYIEEMSRAMSDSLMKLAATVTPPWRSTQMSATTEGIATGTTATPSSARSDSSVSGVTIGPGEVAASHDEVSTNDTNRVKEETVHAEERMAQSDRDSSRLKGPTTPPIVSTVITTSTSPPIAANSMEYFLNDDAGNAAGSTSDRAARLDTLDEDEIMEFSDFTDFKKGKGPAAPAWPSPPSEMNVPQPPRRDAGSTLSIERILNPTERIEPTKDRASDRDDNTEDNNNEATRDNGRSAPIAEDYTFIEAEYPNDAPIPEDDGKRNDAKDNDTSKSDAVATSHVEKKESANSADDEKLSYDKNHSIDYHQVTRPSEEKTRDRASENRREHTSSGKRYEDVVSEIEPEARAEIFELFASGSAGKRLERLLKSRNMSVEELIALRQRGSSKVHLTEVSRLRVPKPKNLQTLEASDSNGEIIVPLSSASDSNEHLGGGGKRITEEEDAARETEESMRQFKQDIMSYLHDPFFDKDAENVSMSRLLDLVERDRNASREEYPRNETPDVDERDELEESRRTMQIVDLLTTFGSLPFAKDVQRQYEAEPDNDQRESRAKLPLDNASAVLIEEEEKTVRSDNSSEFDAGYIEEIVREEPNAIDIRTIYSGTARNAKDVEERKTLSKVKPSIIASGAILGVTIVVFLAIFIVCRIRQKQRYTYRNTFSRAVFQGPVMAARKLSNSSSLSTVMVNVVATSTTKRPERTEMQQEAVDEFDSKSDMDNDSLDANDSWETIPDYAK